jgi:hypothetical protein
MITLTEIFAIIIIHFIADFIFQDEKWALGKSKNWNDLLMHTITYSFIWFIIGIVYFFNNADFVNLGLHNDDLFARCVIIFPGISFIAHTITDYFTSRIVSKKFANGHYGSSIPNLGAFTVIGFDQLLHYIQLFLTYYFLKTL